MSITRKPPAREWRRRPDDFTELGTEYIFRACQLRRERRIGVVLVSAGNYWIGDEPDPWGTKERISCDALRALIDEIDAAEVKAAEVAA